MTTPAGTTDYYDVLRSALFDFVREGGATGATPDDLESLLTGGLWDVSPSDDVPYPYGVMRLQNRVTSGAHQGERETADLELVLWDRPRSQQMFLEDLADRCDEALLRFRYYTQGLVFSRERQRDSLPPGSNPTEREAVGVRMVYSVTLWPQFLTQYSNGV